MAQDILISRREVGIGYVLGLHLRVADKFVRLATTFHSEIQVHCNGIVANGKSILSLLSLAAEYGTMLALEAQGCDAEDAVAALAILIACESREFQDKGGDAV
jgi:phosphocarrier protein